MRLEEHLRVPPSHLDRAPRRCVSGPSAELRVTTFLVKARNDLPRKKTYAGDFAFYSKGRPGAVGRPKSISAAPSLGERARVPSHESAGQNGAWEGLQLQPQRSAEDHAPGADGHPGPSDPGGPDKETGKTRSWRERGRG